MKVLIVESDIDWRNTLSAHVGELSYEVSVCSSLGQARDFLKSRQPDILMTDIGLPDGSLLPELASLRQHFPSMGIVILTAATRLEDKVRCMSDGADYYLVKKRQVTVDDLYSMNPRGRYWYSNGVNRDAVKALVLAAAVCVACVMLPQLRAAADFSWFIGAALGAVFYLFFAKKG